MGSIETDPKGIPLKSSHPYVPLFAVDLHRIDGISLAYITHYVDPGIHSSD